MPDQAAFSCLTHPVVDPRHPRHCWPTCGHPHPALHALLPGASERPPEACPGHLQVRCTPLLRNLSTVIDLSSADPSSCSPLSLSSLLCASASSCSARSPSWRLRKASKSLHRLPAGKPTAWLNKLNALLDVLQYLLQRPDLGPHAHAECAA